MYCLNKDKAFNTDSALRHNCLPYSMQRHFVDISSDVEHSNDQSENGKKIEVYWRFF